MADGSLSKQGDVSIKRTDGSTVNVADTLQKMKDGLLGVPTWVRDATSNDSDKTFTVPANKVWMPLYIHGEIVNTATVGNRTLLIVFGDGANVLFTSPKSANIAASQVGSITMAQQLAYGTTVNAAPLLSGSSPNIAVYGPLTPTYLAAGSTIRVLDSAAVDAAADDMTVILHYLEFNAEDFA